MRSRSLLGLAAVVVVLYAAPASAQRILIYGPGGTGSMPHFPPGATVTVATDPMWRSMTTAQFGTYNLLWVDGNNCGGLPSIFQALVDTQATWGPAVTGRVALNTADPDYHSQRQYIQNHVTWLSALGTTATGGRTGMYFSSGCAYYTDQGPPYHQAFEPTFGVPLRTILLNGEPSAVPGAAHPLMVGYGTIASLSWGNYCHGGIATPYPTGWTSLVTCHGGSGLLVRDMMVAVCGNGRIEAGEACDDGGTVPCDGCSATCTVDINGCTLGGSCIADGTLNPANECERCDRVTSRTMYSPVPAGATCDDGLYCTTADACDGASTCLGGAARDCSTSGACRTGTCDEAGDRCAVVLDAAGTTCDDGLYCTIDDVCDAAGSCGGPARDCSTGESCAAGTCDEAGDRCTGAPLAAGTMCDDGLYCTTDDVCDGAGGCAGAARVCAPGSDCMAGGCDEDSDACASSPAPAGVACDDGVFCTTGDACDGAGGCAGGPRDCDDHLDCTTDSCNEDMAACIHYVFECLIDGSCVEEGTIDPGNICLWCNPAEATDAFSPRAAGSRCGNPTCRDGMITAASLCDGMGTCVPGDTELCVGPDGAPCADERMCDGCRDDAECAVEFRCRDGRCVPDDTGEGCTDDTECTTGFCTDGVCCDSRCDGVCQSCGDDGFCRAYMAGTDPEDECALSCRGTAGGCENPDGGGGGDAGRDAGVGPPRSGGGCCSVAPGAAGGGGIALLLLFGAGIVMALRIRRRR